MQSTVMTLFRQSGFYSITWGELLMIGVGLFLIYLAIFKKAEPLLLLSIGFGCILSNLPLGAALLEKGGFFELINTYLIQTEIIPVLIFLGVGALTDFGPLIANPITLLIGASAQIGIFITFFIASMLNFSLMEAGAIGIIGGATGPATIYTAIKLAPHLLGPIAVAAYMYMALIPIIQPPIMRLLTTKKERSVVMEQLRPVSKIEKILFPIFISLIVAMIIPEASLLIGMFMLGNLLRESGVTDRLAKTVSNQFMDVLVILIATTIGATMQADKFLTKETLIIIGLGIIAFVASTIGGLLFAKLLYYFTKGKVNPLIGSAGVSAVPMAARISQRVGQEENPGNFLLMHAMGPNIAGAIGAIVAAGIMITLLAK